MSTRERNRGKEGGEEERAGGRKEGRERGRERGKREREGREEEEEEEEDKEGGREEERVAVEEMSGKSEIFEKCTHKTYLSNLLQYLIIDGILELHLAVQRILLIVCYELSHGVKCCRTNGELTIFF